MRILGISAFHRDAAAALLVDGKTVAAVQEDRYTKRLQDESFPIRAIRA
ncbi:MAG: carbamoyltransferase, partial [Planctomycetota bacterium]